MIPVRYTKYTGYVQRLFPIGMKKHIQPLSMSRMQLDTYNCEKSKIE